MRPGWLPWLFCAPEQTPVMPGVRETKSPTFVNLQPKAPKATLGSLKDRQPSALPWATQGGERMLLNCTDFESKADTLFENVRHVACVESPGGPAWVGCWRFSRTTRFFTYHPGVFQSLAQVKGETPEKHLVCFLISFSLIIYCLEQRS